MSVTGESKVEKLLDWLERNAFWNSDLVEVRNSKIGGTGVFWKLGDQADPEGDNLLLRIPKSSILSPKNSFLYSMLVEFEPVLPSIDFTVGMHSIVITFVYELSMGERSPWFSYLDSFDLSNAETGTPVCLWSESEKAALYNSELDLLNILDPMELIHFYLECVNFAKANAEFVAIPPVLQVKDDIDAVNVQTVYKDQLLLFSRYVQAVISRAFAVDKFYGLSLVPGADLFNHLSPVIEGEQLVARENVHFVCDDDEGLCEECGEYGCEHQQDSEEEWEDEDGEDEVEADEDVEEVEEGEVGKDIDLEDLMESDVELSDDSESEASLDEEDDDSMEEDEISQIEENKPITMEDIEQVENEENEENEPTEEIDSEAETDHDDEEASTVSLSEDEYEVREVDQDLAAELGDSSKCCDIVMTALPEKKHEYELFNTYGNDLANAYLLQRYGFISPQNPNITCLLSVQMFAYLKKEKANARKKTQLDLKLEWYEEVGFELVNEIVQAHQQEGDCGDDCDEDHDHEGHDHDGHDHDGGDCCDDSGCNDGDCDDGEEGGADVPESWQLSPRIQVDGTPTEQTIVLVRLLLMPFKVFYYKLGRAPSERKLIKRIDRLLLEPELTVEEMELLKTWVSQRLERYRDVKVESSRGRIIGEMVQEEKDVLQRALEVLS